MVRIKRRIERVALDVDETMADVMIHVLNLHNAAQSTNFKMDDVTDWAWKGVGISDQDFKNHYNTVWNKMTHRIDLLVDKKLLLEVSKHYEIDIVTKRGGVPELEATTKPLRKWLEKHGMDKYRLVISPSGAEKDELGYDIYIDDSPKLAECISRSDGKMLFLVNKPHNRYHKITSGNVMRVADANEALRILASRARSRLKHE